MSAVMFPWSDAYTTGVRVLDNDHRELFAIVNELHALIERKKTPSRFEIKAIIDSLARYTREHFDREERLLRDYGYPDLDDHIDKHNDFKRLLMAVVKIEVEEPHRIDPRRLLGFLGAWLEHHILKEDRHYIPFLTGKAEGHRRPDPDGHHDDAGNDPFDIGHDEMVTVTVEVPRRGVETIRKSAEMLRNGGDSAHALVNLTHSVTAMTLREALDIAEIVLRRD